MNTIELLTTEEEQDRAARESASAALLQMERGGEFQKCYGSPLYCPRSLIITCRRDAAFDDRGNLMDLPPSQDTILFRYVYQPDRSGRFYTSVIARATRSTGLLTLSTEKTNEFDPDAPIVEMLRLILPVATGWLSKNLVLDNAE